MIQTAREALTREQIDWAIAVVEQDAEGDNISVAAKILLRQLRSLQPDAAEQSGGDTMRVPVWVKLGAGNPALYEAIQHMHPLLIQDGEAKNIAAWRYRTGDTPEFFVLTLPPLPAAPKEKP